MRISIVLAIGFILGLALLPMIEAIFRSLP
jgi:hypothetical protein